jgi:hypothetical protein
MLFTQKIAGGRFNEETCDGYRLSLGNFFANACGESESAGE